MTEANNTILGVTLTEACDQYAFVNAGGTLGDTNTDDVLGVSQYSGIIGDVASVETGTCFGYLKVDGSGTAIAIGSLLMPSAAGVGIVATGAGAFKCARAMEAATTATVIRVLYLSTHVAI